MRQKLIAKTISDSDLNSLFEKALREIAIVDQYARGQKKKIIIKLAQELEGKIPTDTISTEISIRLKGRVSHSLVSRILPEKYKQKQMIENAKKGHFRKESFILKPYTVGEKRNVMGLFIPSKAVEALEMDVSKDQLVLTVMGKNDLHLKVLRKTT